MMSKSKQELLKLHQAIMSKFRATKIDVKMFLALSNQLLKEDYNTISFTDEDDFFEKYRTYMIQLLNMLEKTTDYVDYMMSNMQMSTSSLDFSFSLLDMDESTTQSSEVSFNDITSINSKKQTASKIPESFLDTMSEMKLSCESNNCLLSSNKNPFKCYAETKPNPLIKRPKIPCGTMDTSIFKIGSLIPCASICSRDSNGLKFCIFIKNDFESDLLSRLYDKKDLPTYTYYPTEDVVFGMKLEGGTVRAVHCLPLSFKKVYLPDFGEIVDMENDLNNIYHLSEEEQNIPGQAIECQLHNSYTSLEIQNDFLTLPLYEPMSFKVQNILNGILHLSPYPKIEKSNNTNTNVAQLTREERELLEEEPTTTTNALKAVLGHVPKDDLRICPHYDPEIDGCFKGSNCRREHVQMPTDYFTKDMKPANVFREKPSMAPIVYHKDEVLEVIVTHIKCLEYFYGIIVDPLMPTQDPLIWNENDISEHDQLKNLPPKFDIVLAKFVDGNWYRAQVLETFAESKEVFVFYLDYGNRQKVHLNKIAKCPQSVAEMPAQAQQFRLANICIINKQEDETIKRGMSMLSDMLNDRTIKVCVVSHHEDLVVQFIEEPYCEIPKILENMHCIKMVEMF